MPWRGRGVAAGPESWHAPGRPVDRYPPRKVAAKAETPADRMASLSSSFEADGFTKEGSTPVYLEENWISGQVAHTAAEASGGRGSNILASDANSAAIHVVDSGNELATVLLPAPLSPQEQPFHRPRF